MRAIHDEAFGPRRAVAQVAREELARLRAVWRAGASSAYVIRCEGCGASVPAEGSNGVRFEHAEGCAGAGPYVVRRRDPWAP